MFWLFCCNIFSIAWRPLLIVSAFLFSTYWGEFCRISELTCQSKEKTVGEITKTCLFLSTTLPKILKFFLCFSWQVTSKHRNGTTFEGRSINVSGFNIYTLFTNLLSLKNAWLRKAIPEETSPEALQLPGCFASPWSATEAAHAAWWEGSRLDLCCEKPRMTPSCLSWQLWLPCNKQGNIKVHPCTANFSI